MKSITCLQKSRLSIHTIPSLTTIKNDNIYSNLYHISHRHKVANPRYSVSRQKAAKLDFRQTNIGQFDESGHEDPNYENIDLTLPEHQFLKDMDPELVKNTYIEYNNHWMKNFIRFTDAEFENFNTKEDPNKSDTKPTGYAKIPESDPEEISQSLQYLDEWKKNLKEKRLEDDYQVKLPNGAVISYDEYLGKLNNNDKDSKYGSKQERHIQRLRKWHTKDPKHDEYGRSRGIGWRKTAKAEALVYEGEGNIYINGKHYSTYFPDYVDRMNCVIPFLVTDLDRKMDAWCVVDGGGNTGKSVAIRMAIARALCWYNPQWFGILYAYRLTVWDHRKRERKKPGKPRARKSVQWKAR